MAKYLSWLWVGALVALGAGCMTPGDEKKGPEADAVDLKAVEALQNMSRFLNGISAFQVDLQGTRDERLPSGELSQVTRECRLSSIRPHRFQGQLSEGILRWSIWYDGKTMTLFDENERLCAQESIKGTSGSACDHMVEKYDLTMPLADLLADQTYESLMENVQAGSYLGLHRVGTHPCHHLLFHQETVDWQIWIDAGDQPFPRKMVITYKQEPGQPQSVMILDGWDIKTELPADTGSFQLPDDTKMIPMEDLLGQREKGESP